jgi:glycosidase
MPAPTSVAQLDLTPKAGQKYFNFEREWREEFIYFLMVDRFHDATPRSPVLSSGRSPGVPTPDDFYGGKIKGVTQNLDYIAGLGCSAIWLSPVFENNLKSYHGYDINNYLDIDPRYGTKQDLIDLVEAAHGRNPPIRIILDVVINHSGDNWEYPGGFRYFYANDRQFDFGNWRKADRPLPTELRDESLYHRRGEMRDYDSYPENQHGDMFGLKDYANDDDAAGSEVINALIKAHCYWIREADVDGFRVDAVKHMGELACSRFCSMIREYAYSLGKRRFFLFGELANPSDDVYDRYIGPNTSRQDGNNTVFFGIDSLLDFRLASGVYGRAPQLRSIIRGDAGPESLFERLELQRNRALNRGELGRYLVTFIDNHDGFWQPDGRFGHGANDQQIIGAIGFLLCGLGTACIYYGTEQGFSGHGGDNALREATFDVTAPGKNLLNTKCDIYKAIGVIAAVMRTQQPLRFGRMYYRQISGDGQHFGFPYGSTYTLAFSRLLYGREVLVAYNVSPAARSDAVVVDADLHQPGDKLTYLYPPVKGATTVQQAADGTRFVVLNLAGHEFAILA